MAKQNLEKIKLTDQDMAVDMESLKPKLQKPDLIKKGQNDQATVNLMDCLACSGCVTTSEVVLMQDQGLENFKKQSELTSNYKIVVISPQSRVSIAQHFGLTIKEAQYLIQEFLTEQYSINLVVDEDFFIDLSIEL